LQFPLNCTSIVYTNCRHDTILQIFRKRDLGYTFEFCTRKAIGGQLRTNSAITTDGSED